MEEIRMDRADIKAEARYNLGNNIFGEKWLLAAVAALVTGAITSAVAFTGIGPLIFTGPLMVAMSGAFLKASREDRSIDLGEMLTNAFTKDFVRNMILNIVIGVFVFLWSLLFIVPGIIKMYSYAMANYIAADHPEYDWKDCMKASEDMMNGRKMELFLLDLSFIGWCILGALVFGIGELLVAPYMFQARTVFYRRIVNG